MKAQCIQDVYKIAITRAEARLGKVDTDIMKARQQVAELAMAHNLDGSFANVLTDVAARLHGLVECKKEIETHIHELYAIATWEPTPRND